MGFEPILSEPQSDVLTINTINTEVNVGIEPTPLVLQTNWPPRPNGPYLRSHRDSNPNHLVRSETFFH